MSHDFRAAVEAQDLDRMVAALAEDVDTPAQLEALREGGAAPQA